jgi:HK97 family phage major capsid protein
VKQGAFTALTLTPKKMGVITTMTREITEHSTPSIEGIVRQAILEDTALAIDSILIDANAATLIRPAGLKNGATAVGPTAGGGIAALIGDLKLLTSSLITASKGNLRAPVWIMNPGDALAAQLTQAAAGGDFPFMEDISNGTLMGYPVITSTTIAVDSMILMDAADFITATGDTPRFDVSDQAVLHMEDTTPAAIGGNVGTVPTVAVPARSLWQTDTIGIRMIMDINWAMRRTGMVHTVTTMTWN